MVDKRDEFDIMKSGGNGLLRMGIQGGEILRLYRRGTLKDL
jgi:hypothetical protein